MIEGLKLEFSSGDLKNHLLNRRNYHSEKAIWYKGQVESLQKGGMRPEAVTNDPLIGLERTMQDHKQKAEFFSVLRAHVIPDETYILSENDLARLEFISRFF